MSEFNKAYEDSIDNELSKAIDEARSKINTNDTALDVEQYMALIKAIAEQQNKVEEEEEEFVVVGKKQQRQEKPTQNINAPLVDDKNVNYADCINNENCTKKHCTFKHTGQVFQKRNPVFNTTKDCVNPVCFNYYCPFKHIGQNITSRPLTADFTRPCNYGDKCTRGVCKFVHPGQKQPTKQLNLGNDFPPLSATKQVSVAKRGEYVEFKPSTSEPEEDHTVHNVAKIIAEKQKIVASEQTVKMPTKFNYTFNNEDFDVAFSKFLTQHCYLNKLQQNILRNVWFNGESVLEDRKIAFTRILDEIIITSTNIVKRYYNVVTDNTLDMNGETVTINVMNIDRFNCKLDDAINIFKDYPFVHNIWNDGNILLDERRDMVQTYYVDKIEENVRTLNSIHTAIGGMSKFTYSEITRS